MKELCRKRYKNKEVMDVRIYRLQVRIIQLSVLLAVIVMIFGVVNAWQSQGKTTAADPAGQNSQTGGSQIGTTDPGNATPGGTTSDPADGKPQNSKIACLGDSFTYGYPGDTKDSWPRIMEGILKVEVVNAGKVYQNTNDLLARFDQDIVSVKPGRVIIFAGVGDALRGKTLEEYKNNIIAMVQKAEANNIKPILALPVPYPGTDQLYNEYRTWEEAYARENDIMTLDFKGVLFDANNKILKKYSDDGKYPNKEGYKVMGEYAANVLK